MNEPLRNTEQLPSAAEIQERHDSNGKEIDALMVEELNEANFEAFRAFLKVHNVLHTDRGILLKRLEAAENKLKKYAHIPVCIGGIVGCSGGETCTSSHK